MPAMKKKLPANELKPEDILSSYSPGVRNLAEHVRKLIKDTIPAVEERAYPGWRAIGFRHPDVGYFCGIFPQEEGVDLAFEFGVLLPDPQAILDGKGKQVRYVHILQMQDIQPEPLIALIQAAIDLPSNRQIRLDMVHSSVRILGSMDE